MNFIWFCLIQLCSIQSSKAAPFLQGNDVCKNGKFYPDAVNCRNYFVCSNGQLYSLSCPYPLVWDNSLLTCISSTCKDSTVTSAIKPSATSFPITTLITVSSTLPATINILKVNDVLSSPCANGKFYPNPTNCQQFFICANGVKVLRSCPPPLVWDNNLLSCFWTSSSCQASVDLPTLLPTPANQATTVAIQDTTSKQSQITTKLPISEAISSTNFQTLKTNVTSQKNYVKAEVNCNQNKCLLPNCRCASEEIPGNLSKEEVPQIVMFTMDDAVNSLNYNFYMQLLDEMKNPNGCPVGATFYVSAEYTDFNLVKELFQKGHEIADHSITHRSPNVWWRDSAYDELEAEVLGEKKMLEEKTGAKISGWRTPFLRPGETMYRVLADNNFLYDTSLSTHAATKWWPYTLDYQVPQCVDEPCPELSYPGLWEVPLTSLLDGENGPECSMFDSCVRSISDSESVYKLLMFNFNQHYKDKKQPFALFGHASYFLHESFVYRQIGFKKFFSEISRLPDVYFVTVEQAVRWTQTPTPLNQLNSFEPWSCKRK
ncbi:chitin deacetylase 8 isoform X1 [Hydra vulgaris]|uniref:chitin deacetylase 8 isoform X1 n=1 Tax=Hydra vulgaris TaxID=6087 RepID=UPI001F5F7A67|nr:chitin deacetylase 8 [Hydra vulgaris]